jgi:predicted helicase
LKGVWWWVSFSFVRAAANANSELMATTFRFESCSGTVERANRSGSPQVSQLLIQQYLNELQKLRRMSGTARESVVREAFKTLLKDWGKSHDLTFIPEYEYQTVQKTRVYPDGALVYELRVPLGYWEAKDEEDDLEKEIERKFRKGYPQDNIIFEDSNEAFLIQNKQEVMRCGVQEPAQLQRLLELFFGYEREEIADFRKAVGQFKTDLPNVLKAMRDMIEAAERCNDNFRKAALRFLKHAQDTINPSVTAADVREMLIQHILTEEIFSQVFDNPDFHHKNNVARELYALENTFFTGKVKHDTLAGLRPYYAAIKSAAALVTSHHEKQKFLKTIYENFYKVYDKKKADRLGVVYTPNEIVRFMVQSADWLCQKHFGKALIDKNVEILDPAAGTGTFITELIEHFRGQPQKLRYKYLEELHADEVAILPYYVANLNIEATYAIINGYEEYPNLCFVDTLDNTAALKTQKGQHVGDLFGGVSEENVARIKRQNKKKISVVIGNPPYNANQLNENENNKNCEYPEIDRRIKTTYIAASTAQKTKLYDMYARFFRWASDRVDENGIIAFVSNSSFIDSRTYDGFRKVVEREFNEIWMIDLKGNARTSGERRRQEGGNIFDDQIRVGIAVYFCIKKSGLKGCRIRYQAVRDYAKSDEKRDFLQTQRLGDRTFEEVRPDKDYNWIKQADNDFEGLIAVANKRTKIQKIGQERTIFRKFANSIKSNRDEWVYADTSGELSERIKYFASVFNAQLSRSLSDPNNLDYSIKWSSGLKTRKNPIVLNRKLIVPSMWRPFVTKQFYSEKDLSDRLTENHFEFFGRDLRGGVKAICLQGVPISKSFYTFAVDRPIDYHLVGDVNVFSAQLFSTDGTKVDNITGWGLEQFRAHYEKGSTPERPISKSAIFHYVYGVLHDPIYREKYALNLSREFPRIPFHADFWRWAEWGERLMALHIGYETVAPWPLERIDAPDEKSRNAGLAPKAMLRANKDSGNIQLDSETQLVGVPRETWTYRLGNRSALEWILDQYKEKTPKDPIIREKFNTYRFVDHKEKVIDLLKRVTRVSVETMKIVEAMQLLQR